jgi:hypothetical protein
MKMLTRLAAGGMMLASAVAANAATISTQDPSTNNGDLLFYVTNGLSQTTYTFVLSGQTLNNYFSSATATSHSTPAGTTPYTVNGDANFTYNFASDTALQSLISGGGSDVQWGIISGAWTPPTANALGNTRFVLTSSTTASAVGITTGQVASPVPSGYKTDIANLNLSTADQTGLPAGVTGTSNGIFGTPSSTYSSQVGLYGADLHENSNIGATPVKLYGVTTTGGSNSSKAGVYNLGSVSFDGTNLTFTGNVATPLPAAAWLLGSGLLGLLGIGRRRDLTQAAA